MNELITLDSNYSTTRRVRQATANIIGTKLKAIHKPEDTFETLVFLPEGEGRQGEGGLRTKGYFKQSQEDKPLITVVTVVYNGEQFLEETILSVINQTYDNVEYIIIDGGSTDGTLDIIKKYEHAIDYWVSEKDKGIYDAMNKGIDLAAGDWLNFMNAGDRFNTDTIFDDVYFSSIQPNILVVYGDTLLSNGKLKKAKTSRWLNYGMHAVHQSMFFRKVESLKYDTKLLISSDYFHLLSLYKKKGVDVFRRLDLIVSFFDLSGLSNSSSHVGRAERFNICIKFNLYFICSVFLLIKNTMWHVKSFFGKS